MKNVNCIFGSVILLLIATNCNGVSGNAETEDKALLATPQHWREVTTEVIEETTTTASAVELGMENSRELVVGASSLQNETSAICGGLAEENEQLKLNLTRLKYEIRNYQLELKELYIQLIKNEEQIQAANVTPVSMDTELVDQVISGEDSSKEPSMEDGNELAKCYQLYLNTSLSEDVKIDPSTIIVEVFGRHLEDDTMPIPVVFIECLINHGADAHATDENGQTFLHKLLLSPQELTMTPQALHNLTDFLLAKNLSSLLNTRDNDSGLTPLMLAAEYVGVNEATMSLLRRNTGVNLTVTDVEGKSFTDYFIAGKPNQRLFPNAFNPNGTLRSSTLEGAISAANEQAVKVLVYIGVGYVNVRNGKSESPLHRVARSWNKSFSLNVTKFLLENGAEPSVKDDEGYTFLHRFVDDKDQPMLSQDQFHDLASFLISKNLTQLFNSPGDFEKQFQTNRFHYSYSSSTPFQLAVKNLPRIKPQTLSLLRDNGVNFNALNNHGDSALLYAIFGYKDSTFLSHLVANGANPKHMNNDLQGLLYLSAYFGNLDQLRYFVNLGSLNINVQSDEGLTPLHIAIWSDRSVLEKVRLLIQNGANVKARDNYGNDPLTHAQNQYFGRDKDRVLNLLRGNKEVVTRAPPTRKWCPYGLSIC